MKNKIKDYQIIESDPVQLGARVKAQIELGWQPLGGAQYVPPPSPESAFLAVQTLVKYE